ncbi:hypothetical protein [Thalassospira lucentensis]|uniref:hypothetical protein n=1 Tax=Thalassospira lucentensis TaxID=168935 RepID=UPI00399D5916
MKIVKGHLDSGLNRSNGWMKWNDIYGWVVVVADQLNYAEMYAREPVFFTGKMDLSGGERSRKYDISIGYAGGNLGLSYRCAFKCAMLIAHGQTARQRPGREDCTAFSEAYGNMR